MSKTLPEYDIFELLGLNFSDEEKQKYTIQLAQSALQKALTNAIRDGKISEEQRLELDKMMTEGSDSLKIQNYIVEIYPGITQEIAKEASNIKREMFDKQLEGLGAKMRAMDKSQVSDADINTVNELRNAMSDDSKDIESLVNSYNQIKTKYNFINAQ